MRGRWAGLAIVAIASVAAVLGVYTGGSLVALPGTSAAPSLALASPPTPRPTPNPSPRLASDGLTVYPLGTVPSEARFIITGEPGDERLLLLDVQNKQVRLAAHFEGFGAFKDARVVELTSTSAGDLLVICVHADGANARLFFVRPASGDVRTLTIPTAENPRLSPDGTTIAVTRNTAAEDQKGLWLLSTADGTGRRITTDEGRRATRAIQWSADGTRLSALLDHLDFKREVVIVGVDGRMTPPLGTATDARWRGDDLVFWTNTAPGPVSIYHAGAVSVAYETPPQITVSRAELKPRSKDLAMRQSTQTTLPKLVLWDATSGATTVKMQEATWVLAFWWSSDGTRLYTWILDNDTSIVTDAITGETVLTFCFRARVDPPCRG